MEEPELRESSTAAQFAIIASKAHSRILILFIADRRRWCVRRQQKVKCSKKKGIIIGVVVASLFGSSRSRVLPFPAADRPFQCC